MKKILLAWTVLILSATCFAETIQVKGMTCGGCEKQVRKAVCKDEEISTWLDSCDAKVKDSTQEIGEIQYTLKKDVKMDSAKLSKIEKAIAGTGRSVIKTGKE